ncbi:ATP-dependent protease [Rhodobacterales bacterium HKCCE2091]|nr:ATP-dependent protease [Rhodobacterales bacterium HKCCE2091]
MMTGVDLPPTIPVFPLPGALLLPRARLPLHIFEPRYLQMLDDTLKSPHRLIGMVQPCEGHGNGVGETPRLHEVGCAGRVTQFSETEDGRYMITLSGISRFRVRNAITGFTPYLKADVSWDGYDADTGAVEADTEFDRPRFLALLSRYFDTMGLSTDWDTLKEAEDELLINSLSMLCPFEPEEKQALLEAPTLAARRQTLLTLIEFALHGGPGEEVVQ